MRPLWIPLIKNQILTITTTTNFIKLCTLNFYEKGQSLTDCWTYKQCRFGPGDKIFLLTKFFLVLPYDKRKSHLICFKY